MANQIFIVDDNPDNLSLLALILRQAGHQVRVASHARAALAAIQETPPDLIMLDITMPEVDGYEMCKLLKADPVTRDVPVIFLSALDDVHDKVRAFEEGGVDYVSKPFELAEVLARVESQLRLVGLRKALEHKNHELEERNQELMVARRGEALAFGALAEVLPGSLLAGRYQLGDRIGVGGFAAVYRATHLQLDRAVAVKVLRPGAAGGSGEQGVGRFQREGASACRVNHPNAVTVLDSGITETGIPYLVMELLEGHSLQVEILECGAFSRARTAEIALPVCDVLAAAHEAGIVHRDIKPDNVFLHHAGGREIVKVVDFGIAKLLEAGPDANLTMAGEIIGTPQYMSPERLTNNAYDGRSDVYSLGVMLYQMLSGQLPFAGVERNLAAIVFACVNQAPVPLRELNPSIPAALDDLVMRAMSKEPDRRPTARELGRELCASLELPAVTRADADADTQPQRLPPRPRPGSLPTLDTISAAAVAAPTVRMRK